MTCFKAYDVRGKVGVNFDSRIVYRIARALAQHLVSVRVVIGYDARQTSKVFAKAAAQGVLESGADVLMIGLAGTEEMYWAVTEFNACAGIEVTASHNPINYNGLKLVKAQSMPLDSEKDFIRIKKLAENGKWGQARKKGRVFDISKEARTKYVKKVIGFLNVNCLRRLKVVVNSGNGVAGPTFNVIKEYLESLGTGVEFFHILDKPDHKFPKGIPNPLLQENQVITSNAVREKNADIGIAFDGDFDRCFFFDESGRFIPGEYIVGLLADIFLEKESGAKIIHDPRVIWNTTDIIKKKKGVALQSRTGHAFFKEAMRKSKAVYGGEMSAHHYFRDFAYCDSGMIPCLLIIELISRKKKSLGELVQKRFEKFPSSGEKNYKVEDPNGILSKIFEVYKSEAMIDKTDGISFSFKNWRFNIRKSNTETLIRLNVEAKGSYNIVQEKVESITKLIDNSNH